MQQEQKTIVKEQPENLKECMSVKYEIILIKNLIDFQKIYIKNLLEVDKGQQMK